MKVFISLLAIALILTSVLLVLDFFKPKYSSYFDNIETRTFNDGNISIKKIGEKLAITTTQELFLINSQNDLIWNFRYKSEINLFNVEYNHPRILGGLNDVLYVSCIVNDEDNNNLAILKISDLGIQDSWVLQSFNQNESIIDYHIKLNAQLGDPFVVYYYMGSFSENYDRSIQLNEMKCIGYAFLLKDRIIILDEDLSFRCSMPEPDMFVYKNNIVFQFTKSSKPFIYSSYNYLTGEISNFTFIREHFESVIVEDKTNYQGYFIFDNQVYSVYGMNFLKGEEENIKRRLDIYSNKGLKIQIDLSQIILHETDIFEKVKFVNAFPMVVSKSITPSRLLFLELIRSIPSLSFQLILIHDHSRKVNYNYLAHLDLTNQRAQIIKYYDSSKETEKTFIKLFSIEDSLIFHYTNLKLEKKTSVIEFKHLNNTDTPATTFGKFSLYLYPIMLAVIVTILIMYKKFKDTYMTQSNSMYPKRDQEDLLN